jgi:iron complex outermembrane receptor protein
MKQISLRFQLATTVMGAALLSAPALAQEAPPAARTGDVIIVTGTRVADRSALDTAVPVDVVTSEALTDQGTTELAQALSQLLPSFNYPRPSLTDGTDNVRPATLRGLAPDQTLLLVNSKRRHATALVNLNGSVGRGSAAADLNAIPTAAIGAIEVLRDGASAQYGSDAIAGVINLRLREASSGGGVTISYGQRDTEWEAPQVSPPTGATWSVSPKRSARDGSVATVSTWAGYQLGEDGFLTVSGEYKDQDPTSRGVEDPRQQYALISGTFDPRELSIKRVDSRFGDPEVNQFSFFANAGIDAGDVEWYGWASYQYRDSTAASSWRLPQGANNVPAIYPNGYLPFINSQVDDFALAGGAKFSWGGWDWDASLVYGNNAIDYRTEHSVNVSLGAASPRDFNSGGLEYGQLVANLGATQGFEVGAASPLNVAFGIEAREETYQIKAGSLSSYVAGPFPGSPGASNFPGFQPQNEVDEDRTAVGAYLDLEVELLDNLLVSAAVRGETYSDFGETLNGKVSARYDFTDNFAVRGAISNGFRAPSLQQSYFTSTATVINAGQFLETGTFPATSAVAIAYGAVPLDAEKSTNYSLGGVVTFGDFNLTVDAYRIDINDQILLSGNLPVTALPVGQRPAGISQARFFLNGVDSEVFGIDLVASYKLDETAIGDFDFTFGATYNNYDIKKLPPNNQFTPTVQLFDRQAQLRFEEGQPDDKYTFSTNWNNGPFAATFRATRYGEVLVPNNNAALDYTLTPKTVVDLEARYELSKSLQFALGAENLLDEYPDPVPQAQNTAGLGFSSFSPFGFNGRFIYGRVSYTW